MRLSRKYLNSVDVHHINAYISYEERMDVA